jgi:beta-N-acetylhexosaminidase
MIGKRHIVWTATLAAVAAAVPLSIIGPSASPASATTALTPQELAGERVIYSYTGLTPPSSLIQAIQSGQAAGVIFFGDNISSDSQIASVVQQLRSAAAQSPVQEPLLLMTDQEGGEVRRLPGEPTLSEKQIGEASDAQTEASQAGTGAGNNLGSVGMNVNLAPVLDVYRQAGDFDDQYQRSYSMDPNAVATLGSAFVTAQQQTGVGATVKHFPGLGAATASEDTDSEPVTLNVSQSDLRSIDEAAYPASIKAGVKLVMVSWAVYPALDATYPAGLSSTIVQGELRNRLGFTGVTITDALEAGALKAFGTTQQRAVAAASAGMDLILCASGDPSQGQDAVNALASAYQSGQLDQSAFTAAVQRIDTLRQGLN